MMTISNFWGGSLGLSSQQPGWVTPSASQFNTPPQLLDIKEFRSWTLDRQFAYVNANASGDPGSVEIGPPPHSVTVTLVAAGTVRLQLPREGNKEFSVHSPGRDATDLELATPPLLLAPEVFLSWKKAQQLAYIDAHGSGNPKAVQLPPSDPITRASLADDVLIGDGVIQRSSGDQQEIPYHHIAGSSSGMPSEIIRASAEALFPVLDGENATLPVENRPEQFYTTPAMMASDDQKRQFLESFATWHSGYQLEYIKKHGTGGELDIVISNPQPSRMTAVISDSDPTKHFIVQSLQKNDFAKMSYVDQVRISGTDAFADIAPTLGLSAVGAATLPSTQHGGDVSMEEYVDELITTIRTQTASNIASTPYAGSIPGFPNVVNWPMPDPTDPDGGPYIAENGAIVRYVQTGLPPAATWTLMEHATLPLDGQQAFITQLEILKEQLARMGVVSTAEIQKRVSELRERFERAFAFFDVKPPTPGTVIMDPDDEDSSVENTYEDVISLDGDLSGINRGYQIFIAQEKRLAELTDSRMQLVRDNGMLFGKNLDVPSLVFQFQSLYNLQLEAQVIMETEEINQQNDLLKTYAAMQDLINKVLSRFQKADGDSRTIVGDTDDDDNWKEGYRRLSEAEKKLLSMFEENHGTGQKHPLETLRNIERPLHDFWEAEVWETVYEFIPGQGLVEREILTSRYELNRFSHTQWSTYGTRLSETVTLINQNSQIKMNDINSLDKQRNRHFELATNALSKMAEIIQNIARA